VALPTREIEAAEPSLRVSFFETSTKLQYNSCCIVLY